MLCNTDTFEHFFCLASLFLLHLLMNYHENQSTVTSIASPGLKLSKSIFCLADSAASMDNCRINAFALEMNKNHNNIPFMRFLQLNVIFILFHIEWNRTNIIWRPFLGRSIWSSCFACKIGTEHLWTIP